MIRLVIIHGQLGSGKTTLIEHLLKHEEFRDALIIENEFASENIHQATLSEHDHVGNVVPITVWNVVPITGGCVCCTSESELSDVLRTVAGQARQTPVILETTGVANSIQLLQKLFLSDFFLEQFQLVKNIYLLDALEVNSADLAKARFLDVRLADLIIVNKIDLCDSTRLDGLEETLHRVTPETQVVRAKRGQIDPSLVLWPPYSRTEVALAENIDAITSAETGTHDLPSYLVYDLPAAVSRGRIEAAVGRVQGSGGDSLLRLKGYFSDEAGYWWQIQATRHHLECSPAKPGHNPLLVLIGRHPERALAMVVEELG